MIAPGGGLRSDRKRWQRCREPDWFLPIASVKAAFRHRFEEALRAHAPDLHAQIVDSVWHRPWNVDVQPAGTGRAVLRYLARYVKRTAISDERILHVDDHSVTFSYIDSQTQRRCECTLTAVEFMRCYLLHVPPPGQHRVRYFGWLHPPAHRRRVIVETLLAVVIAVRPPTAAPPAWHLRCPHCETFSLVFVQNLPRGPPLVCRSAA